MYEYVCILGVTVVYMHVSWEWCTCMHHVNECDVHACNIRERVIGSGGRCRRIRRPRVVGIGGRAVIGKTLPQSYHLHTQQCVFLARFQTFSMAE